MSHQQSLALITPSYAPDLELCLDLAKSVSRFTAADVSHYVLVADRDRAEFNKVAGGRTQVQDIRAYLPSTLLKIPFANCWLNLRHPFPPVRGWVTQQIVKLAAAAAMETDVVLLVDSDVMLIREVTAESFAPTGKLELFELPDGVDQTLPRHHLWHAAARRLLGLAAVQKPVLPDYICWPCAWSPDTVRAMLGRIEQVTGRPWATAIGAELHFSEMILYGVFVREVLGAVTTPPITTAMRCLNHSDESPLDEQALRQLLQNSTPEDLAIMVSAKSGTPLAVRRRVLSAYSVPES